VSAPELYRWESDDDRDRDTLAVITSAILDDFDAGASVLQSLDRESLVSLCWCLAVWHARP
jgi:hypothetical protein